jgi:hypothetical protein
LPGGGGRAAELIVAPCGHLAAESIPRLVLPKSIDLDQDGVPRASIVKSASCETDGACRPAPETMDGDTVTEHDGLTIDVAWQAGFHRPLELKGRWDGSAVPRRLRGRRCQMRRDGCYQT